MKRIAELLVFGLVLGILVGVSVQLADARTSYWGEYEEEASRLMRDSGDAGLTLLLSQAVDEIANDSNWTGTRKECHDLFRDYLATQVGIEPPVNWDAEITDVDDARVDFMNFMNSIVVNDRRLTAESKALILTYAGSNAVFEDISE